MVAESRADRSYGQAVDLWALGILLYQLLTGDVPFVGPNQKELVRKIRAAKPKFPTHMSQPAKTLLRGLLVPAPDERMGLPALKVGAQPSRNPRTPPLRAACRRRGAEPKSPGSRARSAPAPAVPRPQAHPFFAGLNWADVLAKVHPPPFLPPRDALERSAATAGQAAGAQAKGGGGKAKAKGDGGLKPPGKDGPEICLSPSPSHEPLPSDFAMALQALRFSYEGPASAWLPLSRSPRQQHAHGAQQPPLAGLQLPAPTAGAHAAVPAGSGGGGGGPGRSLSQQLAALAISAGGGCGGAEPLTGGCGDGSGTNGSAPPDDRPADDAPQAGLLGGPARGAHARATAKSLSLAINVPCAN